MDLEKAIIFVESHGSGVEQARLRYLFNNERPSPEVTDALFAGQRPDGGWSPFWAPDYSSLDATCYRLTQAEQLGIINSDPAVDRAVNFLAQRQRTDGRWEEEEVVADLAPPWAMPGDLSARLYLTANCGLWAALFGKNDDEAIKSASYLKNFLQEDGKLPGFLHTHWLAGGLWHKLNWEEPSERVFRFLVRNINALATSNLSWLITTMCAVSVPKDDPLVVKAALRLEHLQQPDGRWSSEDGQDKDVHSTLEAIRSLWLCERA